MSVDAEILNRPVAASACPVESTFAIVGGRWKPTILFHLAKGKLRFSELKRAAPLASDRMLTRSLKELERDGLVERTVFAGAPVRVEYSLTPSGHTLIPVLKSMCTWGEQHWRLDGEPGL